ncbi:MAG: hypothetical protein M3N19_00325 [Candidatus Eremiobacteraeota bacterium]|nr:hypothetical protein [Candidatus Eremiobacteraeota bacterium]
MKKNSEPTTPRCYILDEDFRVKLAVRSAADDPLNALYEPDAPIDALPGKIEQIVRQLTAGWVLMGDAKHASAKVDAFTVSVTPLHGSAGRHIGVFVRCAA